MPASVRIAAVCVLALAAACKGPSVPHPMTSQTRYLCCNMHYEKDEISDANYLKGTLIPFGTRVQILEVGRHSVKFQPDGHPAITLVHKYGRDNQSFDEYLERVFPRDDPHASLPKAAKNAKPAQLKDVERVRKQVEDGVVEPGMTKKEVIMALGYPPAHRTPSLDAPMWTYWANRWATFEVYFDGDKVSRVNR
jgi:hypothetical protein